MKYLMKKDLVLPRRKVDGRKGDNGKVLVIGGSRDYVGALALAGLGALRTGVDWVTIAAPEKVGWGVNALSADLVVKKFKGDYLSLDNYKELVDLSKDFDVVLIGNGAGIKKETRLLLKKIIKKINKKLVIDADGIKAIGLADVNNAVITPHKKEFEMFLRNSNIKDNDFKKIQKKLKNNVVLLKGPVDVIISKDKIVYNKTGNAGMTKGGTGDVLAGLVAGFLGQGLSGFQSACNGAYINGMIGDILLKKKKGYSYIASDMVDEIKRVLKVNNV